MERIKRFFRDDSATAEATSTVIMVAAVILLFGAALGLYYGAFNSFFTDVQGFIEGFGITAGVPW